MNLKITVGILAILAVTAFIDTADYREAVNAYASIANRSNLEGDKKAVEADLGRYSDCQAIKYESPESNAYVFTPKARACLIENAPKTKTATGALAFAAATRVWLESHQDDKDVAKAAMVAIDNGRTYLVSMKPWYYDSLSKIADAHNKSVIRRFLFGKQSNVDLFIATTEILSKAEFEMLLPSVARHQADWLRSVTTSK